MARRLEGRRRSGASVARGRAVFLACVGVALALGVVAWSASRPPALSFGRPIVADWPVELGGYGDVGDIAIGDLTGDGRPDLAIISPLDGFVSTLVNLGRGRFAAGHAYAITDFQANELERVAIADLNGDGKRDLVTMRAAGDQIVSVLLNRGNDDFSPPIDYSSGRAPVYPA